MTSLIYTKPKRIWLQNHPLFNEKWVQDRILEDPSLLSLGDVIPIGKEIIQPKAGRLDLLLQDSDANRRYEVELQLGATDETHIIRTLEYWDIERKRYPQYDHAAVIIAENVTSRFLNVIGLFNGYIPLIAIQMGAYEIDGKIVLIFTKVLDEIQLGLEDEEIYEPVDRAYWLKKGTEETVHIADQLLAILQTYDPELRFKYNRHYIGMSKNGLTQTFVIFRPKKTALRVEAHLPKTEETTAYLEGSGIDLMEEYDYRHKNYRLRLVPGELERHRETLARLLREAYEAANG